MRGETEKWLVLRPGSFAVLPLVIHAGKNRGADCQKSAGKQSGQHIYSSSHCGTQGRIARAGQRNRDRFLMMFYVCACAGDRLVLRWLKRSGSIVYCTRRFFWSEGRLNSPHLELKLCLYLLPSSVEVPDSLCLPGAPSLTTQYAPAKTMSSTLKERSTQTLYRQPLQTVKASKNTLESHRRNV